MPNNKYPIDNEGQFDHKYTTKGTNLNDYEKKKKLEDVEANVEFLVNKVINLEKILTKYFI